MATYTYDPVKINERGVDQMRFELGDVEIDGLKDTTALCDEEYLAMINRATEEQRGWSWAKFLCLRAIMMRFSLETDFSAGGATISISQRYERWKELYLRMQKSQQLPTANPSALGEGQKDGGHYFGNGMKENNRTDLWSPFNGVPNRP